MVGDPHLTNTVCLSVCVCVSLSAGEGQSSRGSSADEGHLFSRRKHLHHWLQPHERAPASLVEKCMSHKHQAFFLLPSTVLRSNNLWFRDHMKSFFPFVSCQTKVDLEIPVYMWLYSADPQGGSVYSRSHFRPHPLLMVMIFLFLRFLRPGQHGRAHLRPRDGL